MNKHDEDTTLSVDRQEPVTTSLSVDRQDDLSLDRQPSTKALSLARNQERVRQGRDDWDTVRLALLKTARRRDALGKKRLDLMAERVMDKAIEGNMQAVQFITERIDGKVVTPVDVRQDITVSSVGEAHLHALQRLTEAVSKSRQDEVETIEVLPDTVDSK